MSEDRMAESISTIGILNPKRQKLCDDWDKFIICQTNSTETLRDATGKSLTSFVDAAKERRDDVFKNRKETYLQRIRLTLNHHPI